jgi:hypothetical protein
LRFRRRNLGRAHTVHAKVQIMVRAKILVTILARILLGHQHLPIDACSETRSRNIRNHGPQAVVGRVGAFG